MKKIIKKIKSNKIALVGITLFLYVIIILIVYSILYFNEKKTELNWPLLFIDIPAFFVLGVYGLILTFKNEKQLDEIADRVNGNPEYLETVYSYYKQTKEDDLVYTCLSSWPISDNFIEALKEMKAKSISFLGPISEGSQFLGYLWRYSLSKKYGVEFEFHHRETPGIKFVTSGINTIISASIDENPTTYGYPFPNAKRISEIFRLFFKQMIDEPDSVKKQIYTLIKNKIKNVPGKIMSINEILDKLTQLMVTNLFLKEQQLESFESLIQDILPYKDMRYEKLVNGEINIFLIKEPVLLDDNEIISFDKERLPAFRICVTQECNLGCSYCPKNGENFSNCGPTMPPKQFIEFIDLAKKIGFKKFKFTGGDPLYNSQSLFEIIEDSEINHDPFEIYIATNGVYLIENIDRLAKLKNLTLKVSLDTLNSNNFNEIANVNNNTFNKIIKGLQELIKYKIKAGINMVITKYNYSEIDEMIDFCIKNRFYLKLMDLNYYTDLGKDFHNKHFVELGKITEKLTVKYGSPKEVYTQGNYGIPMSQFDINKDTFIKIKDSSKGSFYSGFCESCHYRFCQEGLYQLTLTSDSLLKICRHNRENTAIDIGKELKNNNKEGIKLSIYTILEKYYFPSKFIARNLKYNPPT